MYVCSRLAVYGLVCNIVINIIILCSSALDFIHHKKTMGTNAAYCLPRGLLGCRLAHNVVNANDSECVEINRYIYFLYIHAVYAADNNRTQDARTRHNNNNNVYVYRIIMYVL